MIRFLRLGLVLGVLVWGGAAPPTVAQQAVPGPDSAAADTTQEAPRAADAQVEARLQATFNEIDAFGRISVTVRNGVARLEGTVVDPQAAAEAERLAQEFEGVRYVENSVTAETDLADRVAPVVSRLEDYGTGFLEYLPVGLIALVILLLTGLIARWIGHWETNRRFGLSPLAGASSIDPSRWCWCSLD